METTRYTSGVRVRMENGDTYDIGGSAEDGYRVFKIVHGYPMSVSPVVQEKVMEAIGDRSREWLDKGHEGPGGGTS